MSESAQEAGLSIERISLVHAEDGLQLIEEYYETGRIQACDDRPHLLRYIEDRQSGIWVAYAAGVPAGCILYRPLPQIANAGELKRLYVRPPYRRRGIAEQLLRASEHFAAGSGVAWLYLDTNDDFPAALAFYQREGYQRCPRYNENPQATIFMRKPLRPTALRQALPSIHTAKPDRDMEMP